MAANPCSQPLKSNPFITYRDPITGKWIVDKSEFPPSSRTTTASSSLSSPINF
jgi:hypothetical protein